MSGKSYIRALIDMLICNGIPVGTVPDGSIGSASFDDTLAHMAPAYGRMAKELEVPIPRGSEKIMLENALRSNWITPDIFPLHQRKDYRHVPQREDF